jgi:isoleucyl-tRNA synthetase
LEKLSQLIAPIAPFFAEWLYGNLNGITQRFSSTSVHHTLFPVCDHSAIDSSLEKRMQLAQDASSLILSIRKKVNIKVRQPLQKAFIPAMSQGMENEIRLVEEIIKSETNIKEIEILDAGNDFIRKKAKANFKTLGKKLGPKMKWAATEIEKFTNKEIEMTLSGTYLLNPDFAEKQENPVEITGEDLEISTDSIPGYEIAGKGSLTVALDITITQVLQNEGNAREFVNRIQQLRKDKGLELTDRIDVKLCENAHLQPSLIEYKTYICREILAESLEFYSTIEPDASSIEVNDEILTVSIHKKTF